MMPAECYSTFAQLKARAQAETPRLACTTADAAGLRAWQDESRRAIRGMLGLERLELETAPRDVEVLERHTDERVIREKVAVRTQKDQWVPAWVLVPAGAKPPFPALLCLHGHGLNKDLTVGRPNSPEEHKLMEHHAGDYGRRLAEQGFLCFCPDARGFGERDGNLGCKDLVPRALMHGFVLTGLRVWDHLCALDYLLTRPDVDARRVGVAGLSMGCEHAMYVAALAPRIAAAVLSCCLRDLREEIHAGHGHCPCSYVPGLLRELDWSDIACLIAPRPLLIQQGTRDYVPLPAVRAAVEKLERVYASLGARERVETDFFEGGHAFRSDTAAAWAKRWLGRAEAVPDGGKVERA